MKTYKVVAGSIMALFTIIVVSMLSIFVANNYPLNPQILDIDLPLRIQEKEAKADNFITYETTFTQYKTLGATVITYLIPTASQEEHIELTRTRTVIPETHNLHVRNNVFIPPGTAPGEYTLHIHIAYQWNRFRTVEVHLGSDTFFILSQDGTIQTPTETEAFRENVLNGNTSPEAPQSTETAPIRLEGESTLKVIQDSPEPTSKPTAEPTAEPTTKPTNTPPPAPTVTPSPLPCLLLPILC